VDTLVTRPAAVLEIINLPAPTTTEATTTKSRANS